MKMFRKSEGFTLVELMVVVLIIGILVAIAIPIFNAARATAQQRSCMANQRTSEGAYQSYLASGGATVATLAALQTALVPSYMAEWKDCDAGGTYTATFAAGNAGVDVVCSIASPDHNDY